MEFNEYYNTLFLLNIVNVILQLKRDNHLADQPLVNDYTLRTNHT